MLLPLRLGLRDDLQHSTLPTDETRGIPLSDSFCMVLVLVLVLSDSCCMVLLRKEG